MSRILKTSPFPKASDSRMDGVRVITPHRAAASALGESYFSLPRLAREVLRTCRGLSVAPDVLARHTLKSVIARVLPEADPGSIATRLREILKTVLRIGIDINSLIEHGSPRVRELGVITKAYRAELLNNDYIDGAELLWAAAHCDPEPRPLFIYGHHRARKEEILFINAIAGDGSTYFLPCDEDGIFTGNREWAERLVQFGWEAETAAAGTPQTVGEHLAATFTGANIHVSGFSASVYPTIEAEVRGVLSRAKLMITKGTDPYQIALVCRDQDAYAPVIRSVAGEYNLPVQIRHKVPLNSTVFGGFVKLLLDAVDQDFGYEAAARSLMQPLGPGLPEGVWTTARLRHASGRKAWDELGIDLAATNWPESQTLAGWTASLKGALEAFGVRQRAARHAREILAHDRFLESLWSIAKFEDSRVLRFEQFSAIVAEVLADESVPFAPGSAGVTLFEPNTILGAKFDHLFVMGMAEGVFPAPATENPVIDFYERKLLGQYGIEFEEAAEVGRWEALSFYLTLLAGERSVSFSYPSTIDNGERMPNSFFDRLGVKPAKAPVDPNVVSSVEERRTVLLRTAEQLGDDPVIDAARSQFDVELSRENSPVYNEFDGVIGIPLDPSTRVWSASQLTTIGQCSFRWFAQRVLRLDPVDEIELGMDYTKRGTFYHRVLEIAVAKAIGEADIRGATLRHLDEAFAEAENDPEVAVPTLLNWDLQRQEHITALKKAVESAEFIGEGSRVVGLEQKFEDVWQGFPVVGYIDRVDDTPNGLIAIDYKTSSAAPKGAKDEEGKLTVDVQIPLYSNVALKKLYPEGTLGDSIYYSLVKGKVLRKEKEDDFEKLEALAGRIRFTLAGGNFAVDPDKDEYACTYCQYDQVCRKGPRLERKLSNQ